MWPRNQDHEEGWEYNLHHPTRARLWWDWLTSHHQQSHWKRLQYTVKLLSWASIKDICKDDGVFKMIFIQRKKWENPKDLDEVFGKMLNDTFMPGILWFTYYSWHVLLNLFIQLNTRRNWRMEMLCPNLMVLNLLSKMVCILVHNVGFSSELLVL